MGSPRTRRKNKQVVTDGTRLFRLDAQDLQLGCRAVRLDTTWRIRISSPSSRAKGSIPTAIPFGCHAEKDHTPKSIGHRRDINRDVPLLRIAAAIGLALEPRSRCLRELGLSAAPRTPRTQPRGTLPYCHLKRGNRAIVCTPSALAHQRTGARKEHPRLPALSRRAGGI